jgi:hypothetical protein
MAAVQPCGADKADSDWLAMLCSILSFCRHWKGSYPSYFYSKYLDQQSQYFKVGKTAISQSKLTR